MDASLVVDTVNRVGAGALRGNYDFGTSLSGHSVIIKKISLPTMPAEELAESIRWEAEQYVPFDINDVNLDYVVLDAAGRGDDMDVLLVAVKKDKIGDYTSVITQAGKTAALVGRRCLRPPERLRSELPGRARTRGRAREHRGFGHERQHSVRLEYDLLARHLVRRQPVHRRRPEAALPLVRPGRGAQEG